MKLPSVFIIASVSLLVVTGSIVTGRGGTADQVEHFSLESANVLRLHNVKAEPAELDGKKGLRITVSGEAAGRFQTLSQEEQAQFSCLASIDGLEFTNGVIEAEVAGAPAPGAFEGARGFVGMAFRVQSDMKTYDSFYLRPTNGRAEDQERRNHAVQYVSSPGWPWFRLRNETPSRYEAYSRHVARNMDQDQDRSP